MPKKKKKVIQMKSVSDTGVNTEAQQRSVRQSCLLENAEAREGSERISSNARWIYNERFRNEAKAESERERERES